LNMTKKQKFTPILGDLSQLTKDQQNEYVLAACDFLGVPPELGLINLSWMDAGDGARQLILYVKRGATDIIRDHRKIDTDSSEEFNGDGYVGWKSKGHDATGRHEIGIGTVSIRGLNGRAIADAIKTAHTQSLRRMTLQFAGGGFLDETEIQEKTTNIANAAATLQQIAQPTVQVNTEAGKDITDASKAQAEPSAETPKLEPLSVAVGDGILLPMAQAAEPVRQKRRGRPRKIVNLDSAGVAEQADAADLKSAADTSGVQVQVLPPAPSSIGAEPPNEGRKRATNDSSSEEMSGSKRKAESISPGAEPSSAEMPTAPIDKPSKEQMKSFRERLSKYVNEILPASGFLQSEKLGSRNAKMGLFAQSLYSGLDTKSMSVGQWQEFLGYLDDRLKAVGAVKLVQEINLKIGEDSAN
jgi:hypothetical protein